MQNYRNALVGQRSLVTEIQPTAMVRSKLKVQATLSPMVAVVTSHAQRLPQIEIPKPWILQRPISSKTTSPIEVDDRKWQRAWWGTKPKWQRHQKPVKLWLIETAISWLLTASIGGFPDVFRCQGWHGDDQRLKIFRSVLTLAGVVAENKKSEWVKVAGQVGSG